MRSLRYAVPVLALAAGLLSPVPAHAATVSSTYFAGFINLGTMPCSGTSCQATFNATVAAGTIVTTQPGYGVVTSLSFEIQVTEPLCVFGLASPTGSAEGTMTLSGVNVVGGPLSYSFGFRWTRVGNVAIFDPLGGPNGWITFNTPRPCFGNWSPAITGYIETS